MTNREIAEQLRRDSAFRNYGLPADPLFGKVRSAEEVAAGLYGRAQARPVVDTSRGLVMTGVPEGVARRRTEEKAAKAAFARDRLLTGRGGQGDVDGLLGDMNSPMNPLPYVVGGTSPFAGAIMLAPAVYKAGKDLKDMGVDIVDDPDAIFNLAMLGTVVGKPGRPMGRRVIEVPALRAPRALWEQYGKIYPSVAADALSRGFQTYRKTNGYELPFQTGLGRSVIHEPESMARLWESLAQGFERLSGTGESAPGKITRLSGVYDINALGANHDDVGRTNMKKWMDIWRETGFLPVSSIYGTGETIRPVVQPSGKTLKAPVPGTANPWSMKSHFTGVVPVERQGGRYVDAARNYSAGEIADLVNMNAHTLDTSFQLISEPAFLNTVLQPVIRESQTTTPIGPALGGGHVLRGTKVFQPGEAVRPASGWSSPRWAAKGGDTRKSVRADEAGGDSPGSETAVSETAVSEPAPKDYRGPRIVINPTTFKNKKDALCVAFNEAFRVVMEDMGFDPAAEPTDRQREFFADTAYSDDETQLRRTILARICTFDTSVKDPTDEQLQEAVEFLESVMEAGYPQNEWEQSSVQRIHDVVARAVGAPRADEAPEETPEPPSAPGGEGAVQAAEGGGVSGGDPYFDENGKPRPLEDLPKLPEGYSYAMDKDDPSFITVRDGRGFNIGGFGHQTEGDFLDSKAYDEPWNVNGTVLDPSGPETDVIGPAGTYFQRFGSREDAIPSITSLDSSGRKIAPNAVDFPWVANQQLQPAAPTPVPDYDFVTDAVTTRGSEKWWDEQFGSKQQVGPTVEAAKQLQQAAPAQQAAPEQRGYRKTATGGTNRFSQLSREDRNIARQYRDGHRTGAEANRMAGVTYSGIYTTEAGLNGAAPRPDKYTGRTPTRQRSAAMVPEARPAMLGDRPAVQDAGDFERIANRRRKRMWGDVD